ncbi:hypothetical protein CRUP_020152, partial [Coryphaenoides rupestris]
MSSKDGTCRKFKANIFNKSKCQNCFKPRESHLLNDEDLNQAKPTYGGWLLLAPEGTNFDNPLHRSRKWQRRFFVLYEHGLLRYALDEMGTINMNQCSDVVDGESRTGQKNSLGILTPDRDHFVRAECKEIINGWQEALTVYPRTNKHNLKKKRKVEPPTPQEPGPAKVAVTSVGTGGGLGGSSSSIANGGAVSGGRKPRVESGYFSLEKTKYEPSDPPQHLPLSSSSFPSSSSTSLLGTSNHRRSQVIGRFHGGSPQECMDTQVSVEMPSGPVSAPRQGRTERRYLANDRVSSRDVSSNSNLPRAKSLDRRAATPAP